MEVAVHQTKLGLLILTVTHALVVAGYDDEDIKDVIQLISDRWPHKPPAASGSALRLLQLPAREVVQLNYEREVA